MVGGVTSVDGHHLWQLLARLRCCVLLVVILNSRCSLYRGCARCCGWDRSERECVYGKVEHCSRGTGRRRDGRGGAVGSSLLEG